MRRRPGSSHRPPFGLRYLSAQFPGSWPKLRGVLVAGWGEGGLAGVVRASESSDSFQDSPGKSAGPWAPANTWESRTVDKNPPARFCPFWQSKYLPC